MMQSRESLKRAKLVMAAITGRNVEHVDIAMYTLHNVAVRQRKKMVLKRQDLSDVRQRLQAMYPAIDAALIPPPTLISLPSAIGASFLGDSSCFKVEWFYMGSESSYATSDYRARFHVSKQGNKHLYNKAVDTIGLSKYSTAMLLWLESLYRPGKVIKYEGLGYHQNTHTVHPQVVRVMSLVLDYEHVISVTVVQC